MGLASRRTAWAAWDNGDTMVVALVRVVEAMTVVMVMVTVVDGGGEYQNLQ